MVRPPASSRHTRRKGYHSECVKFKVSNFTNQTNLFKSVEKLKDWYYCSYLSCCEHNGTLLMWTDHLFQDVSIIHTEEGQHLVLSWGFRSINEENVSLCSQRIK